ncbi:tRNA (adenosine(37)-N6)-threonylcarbamoyltransferase complex dimerization subunit type 1 TsaB [Arthrobacter psychrochitiniphilus]|uniref:tRNA (Adenosine(37)-N6)-threonylcarbamoyltransferase complex dimerization subunit type 1 TsaB n=1 Tax=Arthrobacter psychrochitiniphilus TaxID=291045 RepID=A0A2V3DUK7_9MICC|nr:tRNA (adenosine(37)-N6)-threonylcarbamoyltransferase complex dimerization subunit type 1 TsaB [Arthrobacter psychrochitiniphilus]NYG18645.1 tRNA threonylcarbamoyl adenosine modification protein YeaZ [Arthrobacter psychrochitiniphilus]PXA66412.1 tRNA (adenosine(37)-N6)-threonylcarbamoyltransferase complex dimerization subunit type 1 TsaB [Arthrobacter psychrochitiniphilus]
MRILTIDTSAIASAALLDFDPQDPVKTAELVANFATVDTRSQAEELAPGVKSLFTDPVAEGPALDAIIVGTGPGPFTGLRSGIAMARTLSFTWGVPLYGMMSLDALAQQVFDTPKKDSAGRALGPLAMDDFVIATDARRKEVYWAKYSAGAHLLDGPHVGPAADIFGVPVFGAGAGLYEEVLVGNRCTVHAPLAHAQPTALELGRAAIRKITAAGSLEGAGLLDSTPLYLRESDAKVPGPRKRAL